MTVPDGERNGLSNTQFSFLCAPAELRKIVTECGGSIRGLAIYNNNEYVFKLCDNEFLGQHVDLKQFGAALENRGLYLHLKQHEGYVSVRFEDPTNVLGAALARESQKVAR
ncbi:MAG: hypothetical protein J0M34_03930 [Alphaproteobacteria bacterium]|nr:hypothetical protein [Alphaproteobacteria bacterium]